MGLRVALFLVALLPLRILAAQDFVLDQLMKSSAQHRAPPELRKQLAEDRSNRDTLLRCRADKQWGLENIEDFFAAVPLTLAPGSTSFLVFPAKYCPGFFGAHSIPYWVMERQRDGSYRQLLTGAEDVVKVLDTRTKGYRDIALQYGIDPPRTIRFDGAKYVDR